MAIEPNTVGDMPQVADSACVHPSAIIIGNVRILDRVFIGPQAVIRADEPDADGVVAPVVICERANLQDCVVIHALSGTSVVIEPEASVAHGAIVHGPCAIGPQSFVGFNSVVFNATLGDGVVVLHQALVQDVQVPTGTYVPSATAVCCEEDVQRLGPVPDDMRAFARKVSCTNIGQVEALLKKRQERGG
jgi:carbonic anhydrase/acetyltransferase-like protein (isoleucine patch superfamily)